MSISAHHQRFGVDPGYYEFEPGLWFCGKFAIKEAFARISRESLAAAQSVDLRDTDVLCATYPKSGQTWLLTIVNNILEVDTLKEIDGTILPNYMTQISFLEMEFPDGENGIDKLNQQQREPRIIKTHLPFHLLKDAIEEQPKVKIIQIMRNPRDSLVSYYHHMCNDATTGQFSGSWDEYFELIKEKKLCWGDIFETTADWYNFLKDRDNTLILKYEDMKKDPRNTVINVAEFLNKKLSDDEIDLITDRSSFPKMKTSFNAFKCFIQFWKEDGEFIRKGQVGDWENYFNDEQINFVDDQCQKHYAPLGLSFEYFPKREDRFWKNPKFTTLDPKTSPPSAPLRT